MFENRSLKVQMVKTPKQPEAAEVREPRVRVDPLLINYIAKDQVKHTVTILGAAFAAKKVLDTVCEIAVIKANRK